MTPGTGGLPRCWRSRSRPSARPDDDWLKERAAAPYRPLWHRDRLSRIRHNDPCRSTSSRPLIKARADRGPPPSIWIDGSGTMRAWCSPGAGGVQGGSITQQLAKNLFLSRHHRAQGRGARAAAGACGRLANEDPASPTGSLSWMADAAAQHIYWSARDVTSGRRHAGWPVRRPRNSPPTSICWPPALALTWCSTT